MADLTPAATLRAAATRLRETASRATPGPWEHASTGADGIVPRWIIGPPTDANDPWSAAEVIGVTSEMAEALADITEPDRLISDGDMDWIALMSPAVAEPLAAWLEEAAVAAEFLGELADKSLINLSNALAVARAITGTTPTDHQENPS